MPVLKIDGFSGVVPLLEPRKLPDTSAQLANNCIFDGADLTPLRSPTTVADYGINIRSAFMYARGGVRKWLLWGVPVNVVNSPSPNDTFGRIYWTGEASGPRYATRDDVTGAFQMDGRGRALGVPQPTVAPTVDMTTIEEPAIAAASMAKTSPVRVTTSYDHPFSDGQKVVVSFRKNTTNSSVPDQPPARTGMVELNGNTYTVKSVKNGSGIVDPRAFDLIGSDGATFSAYEPSNWVANIARLYTDSDKETRSYVYTWVTQFGEEGPPSPPSEPVDVIPDTTIRVTATGPTFVGGRVRLYRTQSGETGTNFAFVMERTTAGGSLVFEDAVKAISMGELLPSETWTAPPAGLQGMVSLPNGIIAGFIDRTVYFSEPYMAHAWPDEYRKTTQDEIVGLEVYGQTLAVITKGKLEIATGTDSMSMSMARLDFYAPCINARGITSTGSGVFYPSTDGLVFVSSNGPQLLTLGSFRKDQWRALWNGSKVAAFHDNRYVVFDAGGAGGLIIEPGQGGLRISMHDTAATACAINTDVASEAPTIPADNLCFANGGLMSAFNYGTSYKQAQWVSKVFTLPQAASLACIQVFASGYPVTVTLHAAPLLGPNAQPGTLNYPLGDAAPQVVAINGPEPQRLSGVMAREWRMDVVASVPVQMVALASAMDELREV